MKLSGKELGGRRTVQDVVEMAVIEIGVNVILELVEAAVVDNEAARIELRCLGNDLHLVVVPVESGTRMSLGKPFEEV